jgi:hypothetical protein
MAASDSGRAEQGFSGQTLREIIYVSAGGEALRVHLSELFGTRPLTIGSASVGVVLDGGRPRDAAASQHVKGMLGLFVGAESDGVGHAAERPY